MKKEYFQPQLECMIVAVGQIMTDSPGGMSTENQGQNGVGGAPARTLYL